jgi:hypothetical protein
MAGIWDTHLELEKTTGIVELVQGSRVTRTEVLGVYTPYNLP